MNLVHRLRWKQLRVFVVPAVLLLAAMGWLVIDGLRMRNLQLSKYDLPSDNSARSMLNFMRKMEGSAQFSDGYFETSNAKSVCQAIEKSYEFLKRDEQSLTADEKREAEFYQLCFQGFAITQGLHPDAPNLEESFLNASREFFITAREFASRERQAVQVSMRVLDGLGRVEKQREFIAWLLNQLNQRSEFSSEAAKETALSLKKTENRLGMIHEVLALRSSTLDGRPFELESLRGKVVLVEFWGTRCKPCIADFPALKRVYATNKPRGFEIVSICLNAAPARIESFAAEHQLPWIQLCDDKSASAECNEALSERFGIQFVPTTLLLDTDGRVVAMSVRPLAGDADRDLEHWLEKLIRK